MVVGMDGPRPEGGLAGRVRKKKVEELQLPF